MVPTEWQPIETAAQLPEDGQRVLIWVPPYLGGYWRDTRFLRLRMPGDCFEGYSGPWPQWWAPMPPAPRSDEVKPVEGVDRQDAFIVERR
jgi:hypothetical protein